MASHGARRGSRDDRIDHHHPHARVSSSHKPDGGTDPPGWVLLASMFAVSTLASAAFSSNLVPALSERGSSPAAAAVLGGLMGVMQLPGRALLLRPRCRVDNARAPAPCAEPGRQCSRVPERTNRETAAARARGGSSRGGVARGRRELRRRVRRDRSPLRRDRSCVPGVASWDGPPRNGKANGIADAGTGSRITCDRRGRRSIPVGQSAPPRTGRPRAAVQWNRNLRQLAASAQLDLVNTARLSRWCTSRAPMP